MLPYVVVDASVAGAWSFTETYSPQAQLVLAAIDGRRVHALAPDRFQEEVLRICQKKILSAPIRATDAWDRFLNIVTLPFLFVPSDDLHEHAWTLTLSHPGLTTHDALYLALCEQWGAELWTLDDKLAACSAVSPAHIYDLRYTSFPY